jgi:hypothetical protein
MDGESLPWGATTAPAASTVLRVDPGDDVQARLTAFVDGLRQRNELAPRIDVMLGPGRYFGDVRITRDFVTVAGELAGGDDAESSTTILGRIVVEDCVGARIVNVRVLQDAAAFAFPVGVTVRNPRSRDSAGLRTSCELRNCRMIGCHVKVQNETRLRMYDTVIDGSGGFGILCEFGADVLLFGETIVERCNIGLLSHKTERDRTRAKPSTIRILSNAVVIRDCKEADEMTSGGGLIIRFIGVLEELLDSVQTGAEITALFKRMETALAILPEGPSPGMKWTLADFRQRATKMALRVGPQVWKRGLVQHFGKVLRHITGLPMYTVDGYT